MDNIFVKNKQLLQEKINQIKSDGKDKFHVIADFDRTLTYAFSEGKKVVTGIGQIRDGGYLTEGYPKKAYALFDEYHPYEVSDELSTEEKSEKMQEWWSKHLELKVRCGMNRGVIESVLEKNNMKFRDFTKEVFDILKENNIPVLIFSAGLGDLIEGRLSKYHIMSNNIEIVSNFYDFNDDGTIKGYKGEIIHTFNKGEVAIKDTPYLNKIQDKQNVILLGDSLGDTTMADGISHDTVIKIGFLNADIENKLEKYMEEFDVVITEDSDMEYVLEIVNEIIE